jgi:hypothetical protein
MTIQDVHKIPGPEAYLLRRNMLSNFVPLLDMYILYLMVALAETLFKMIDNWLHQKYAGNSMGSRLRTPL